MNMFKKIACTVLALVLLTAALAGCGSSRDVKSELTGEWFIWHWYYNVKDGDNGFFDKALFYTFSEDGKVTITSQDESVAQVDAEYTFTGKDTIEITYPDGAVDSMQLIPSEHDGVNQIQMMNVDTNYTLTLEPMDSWSN